MSSLAGPSDPQPYFSRRSYSAAGQAEGHTPSQQNRSGTGMRWGNGVCLCVLVQRNLAKMGHSDRTHSQRALRLGAMSGDSVGIKTS